MLNQNWSETETRSATPTLQGVALQLNYSRLKTALFYLLDACQVIDQNKVICRFFVQHASHIGQRRAIHVHDKIRTAEIFSST